jgi:anthranilate/para-aminobenzoate synthase component II
MLLIDELDSFGYALVVPLSCTNTRQVKTLPASQTISIDKIMRKGYTCKKLMYAFQEKS